MLNRSKVLCVPCFLDILDMLGTANIIYYYYCCVEKNILLSNLPRPFICNLFKSEKMQIPRMQHYNTLGEDEIHKLHMHILIKHSFHYNILNC